MGKYIKLICLLFFCVSCSVTSKLYETKENVVLYSQRSEKSKKLTTIPKGKIVSVKNSKGYKRIKYKKYYGWSNNPSLKKVFNKNNSSHYGGSVRVKGYYRKDGTYVRPHTRSSPKTKRYKPKYKYKRKSYRKRKPYKRKKNYRKKRY
ncbi:hypothetical protein F7018_08545 [Tenacibaculum aiptasiae]|uniref:SH3 domain-containing protein n=1 Tax=Tenacibaculum aiptasiae TaxID=426481 RepID=A0A7J5AM33_9FLAO|nr:hypothetical protein [Tenacibaculum aiptasiae]KAB1158657.1 hypothetical protein F7018_08545 [Tenacibaculum aiptasiae]